MDRLLAFKIRICSMRAQLRIASTCSRLALLGIRSWNLIFFFTIFGAQQSQAQTFDYLESDNPMCQTKVLPSPVPPKRIERGASVAGAIRVSCGFTQGSYTVTLSASDPHAKFSPKTFLVNFGAVSGPGKFLVSFETVGEQTIFATITSNMGSPVLLGSFKSSTNVVNVQPGLRQ